MIQYLRPSFWRVALRDPLTWLALAVDFVPVYMVIMHGWGATALVLLYWCENLVIGGATFVRIFGSSLVTAGKWGILLAAFMCAFFTVHYGMFCFGHGIFIFAFAPEVGFDSIGPPLPQTLITMFNSVLDAYPLMKPVLLLICAFQLAAVVKDYWPTQNKKYPQPMEEMFAPYGRIMVLHIGIFAGAGALLLLGSPMVGVLGLIVFRMLFSVVQRSTPKKSDAADMPEAEPENS